MTLNPGGYDGMCIVRLNRVDGGVATYKYVLLGFLSSGGYLIPCPGASGNLFDIGDSAAIALGTAGGAGVTYMDSLVNRILRDLIAASGGAGVGSIAASGEPALTGAVTLSAGAGTALTQVGNDISIALTGGAAGPAIGIAWDPGVATDAATGTYQTWAEVRTLANATVAPLEVYVKATASTSGTSTDNWPHVVFRSDDTAVTLTMTEGVVIKNARLDMAGSVTSTATTTTPLLYSDASDVLVRGKLSATTKGLIGVDGDGTISVHLAAGSIVSSFAFHSDLGDTVNVYMGSAEFEGGAVDHFEGTAGTVSIFRSSDTIGEYEIDTFAGAINRYTPGTPEKIQGVSVSSAAPTAGYVLVATSSTAAAWDVCNAKRIQAKNISTTAPVDGDVLTYNGETFEWEPVAGDVQPRIIACGTWSASGGTYTLTNSFNVASVTGYDYGSGTKSLKITLTAGDSGAIPQANADPAWVSTTHLSGVYPKRVSSTEIRVDYRNVSDTQISTDNGSGTFVIIARR